MILTSKNNSLIKLTAALKDKKGRKDQGLFLAEGEKLVCECLKSGLDIDKIFLSESYPKEYGNGIRVSDEVFSYLSDEKSPQGILCTVKIPSRTLRAPQASCLLLDGVADPGNMGTIIRTANAAGYKEIYLINCVDPYSPKSVRASMSGIFFTELFSGSKEDILSVLKDIPLLCADMNGENIFSFTPPQKFVLAIGNEANGISEEVAKKATYTVKIPMESTQESLNAGIAAGIAMYTLAKDKFIERKKQ